MSLRTIKLPRQSLWPVESGQINVTVEEVSIHPGKSLCPTDTLMTVGGSIDDDIANWPVTCPFAGTVTRVFVRAGEILTEGTPLCEINTDTIPNQRLISIATRTSIMGRSRALVEDVLRIAELKKCNPSYVLTRDDRQILQEWSNCTDWFFEAYGDKIRRFALSLLRKGSSPAVRNNADDLASEVMLTVRGEWDRGVLLRAYLANCDKNKDKDVSTLFRTYLMGRVRRRIIDVIRRGKVELSLDTTETDLEEDFFDNEDWDREMVELVSTILKEEHPQETLERWKKRLLTSLGDKSKLRVKYWLAAETLALKDDLAAKIERYPDDLREGRKSRSIEREWQRSALDPIILIGYDELKNGTPAPRSQNYSDELYAKAIATTLIRADILVSWENVLRVILRSCGVAGEAD